MTTPETTAPKYQVHKTVKFLYFGRSYIGRISSVHEPTLRSPYYTYTIISEGAGFRIAEEKIEPA